jgi:hypothetical protein
VAVDQAYTPSEQEVAEVGVTTTVMEAQAGRTSCSEPEEEAAALSTEMAAAAWMAEAEAEALQLMSAYSSQATPRTPWGSREAMVVKGFWRA